MSERVELEVRARILGLLLREARQRAGKGAKECAALLGCSPGNYRRYESGREAASLPELELLAYLFDVPLAHFLGHQSLAMAQAAPDDSAELVALRTRMVGAQLRAAREAAGVSKKDLAEAAGVSPSRLAQYVRGHKPIPLPELEAFARALGLPLDHFLPQAGPVATWTAGRRQAQRFREMPPEVREFVADPVNESYLRLAMKLASLSVDRLRGIAEGILDITY